MPPKTLVFVRDPKTLVDHRKLVNDGSIDLTLKSNPTPLEENLVNNMTLQHDYDKQFR
jgi:hypothetical protein